MFNLASSECLAANGELLKFPAMGEGTVHQLLSPDAHYLLIDVSHYDTDANIKAFETTGALYLLDLEKSKVGQIYTYNRHGSACWSPKSDALAISDYDGSDHAACYIYLLDGVNTKRRIVIEDEFRKKVKESAKLLANHHFYFEAVEWLDDRTVKIRLYGHGEVNPSGFNYFYKYDVEKNKFTLLSKDDNDEGEV